MSEKKRKNPFKHVDFQHVINYLKYGTYPPRLSENSKRNLRKRAQSFRVEDQQLFYTACHKDKDDNEQAVDRLVLTNEEDIKKVLAELHIDEKGNHLGREKLGNKVNEKYYFMGVTSAVNNYIDSCTYCQVHRPSSRAASVISSDGSLSALSSDTEDVETIANTVTIPETIEVKVEGHPKQFQAHHFWEIVEMNILGPYKCKESEFYIVVFLDLFSSWPEAFVVDRLSPSTITHLILKLICRFGSMKTILIRPNADTIKDNIVPRQDILTFLGLEININQFGSDTTYVIWDDIKEATKNFALNNSHWPFCLDFCLLPFRISRAESSEYTPCFITYGREINIPEKIHQRQETSYMSAEPHLASEQMAKISLLLLEAFKMLGRLSPPMENCAINDTREGSTVTPRSGRRQSASGENPYNTRRSKDVDYKKLSSVADTDQEAQEDMPPPDTSSSPEPRRKRRKMSRPGRIKVEDESPQNKSGEEGEQDLSKSSSMDEDTWEAVRRDIAHQVLANFHRSATAELTTTAAVQSPPEPPIRKRHICDACGKEFSRSDTLKRHRRETHENETANPNICNECGVAFKRKDHLRRHQSSTHKGHVLKCKYCDKNFGTRNKLDYHIMLEHDKRFQCQLCDKRFGSSTSFKRHVAAHENSDFRCPYCLQDFETREVANIHKEVCKLTMKYPCTVCGEAFKSKSSYQHHEASHYDGKFPCHTCGIKFSFSTNLNRHIRTVHYKGSEEEGPVNTQKDTSVLVSTENTPAKEEAQGPLPEHNTPQAKENITEGSILRYQPGELLPQNLQILSSDKRFYDQVENRTPGSGVQKVLQSVDNARSVDSPTESHIPRVTVQEIEKYPESKLQKALHREMYSRGEPSPSQATQQELTPSPQPYTPTPPSSYPSNTNGTTTAAALDVAYQRGPLPSVSIFNHRGLQTMFRFSDLHGADKIGNGMAPYTGFNITTAHNTGTTYSHPEPLDHSSGGGDGQLTHTFTDQRTIVMPVPTVGGRDGPILSETTLDPNRTIQGVSQESVTYSIDQPGVYPTQASGIFIDRPEYTQEKL